MAPTTGTPSGPSTRPRTVEPSTDVGASTGAGTDLSSGAGAVSSFALSVVGALEFDVRSGTSLMNSTATRASRAIGAASRKTKPVAWP